MKKVMIAALLCGQLLTASAPAAAADLDRHANPQMGAFGGLRLRLPLDGNVQQRRVRAGLTLAPTLQSRSANGALRTRIGEGLELGLAAGERPRLSLAGTPVSQLVGGSTGPDGHRLGVSTAGGVAIAV